MLWCVSQSPARWITSGNAVLQYVCYKWERGGGGSDFISGSCVYSVCMWVEAPDPVIPCCTYRFLPGLWIRHGLQAWIQALKLKEGFFFFFVGTALSRGRVHSGRETLRDAAFHRITNKLIYWPTCGQLYTASHRDGRSKETNRPFFPPSQKDKAVKHKVTQTHKQRERGQLIMNPFR